MAQKEKCAYIRFVYQFKRRNGKKHSLQILKIYRSIPKSDKITLNNRKEY